MFMMMMMMKFGPTKNFGVASPKQLFMHFFHVRLQTIVCGIIRHSTYTVPEQTWHLPLFRIYTNSFCLRI